MCPLSPLHSFSPLPAPIRAVPAGMPPCGPVGMEGHAAARAAGGGCRGVVGRRGFLLLCALVAKTLDCPLLLETFFLFSSLASISAESSPGPWCSFPFLCLCLLCSCASDSTFAAQSSRLKWKRERREGDCLFLRSKNSKSSYPPLSLSRSLSLSFLPVPSSRRGGYPCVSPTLFFAGSAGMFSSHSEILFTQACLFDGKRLLHNHSCHLASLNNGGSGCLNRFTRAHYLIFLLLCIPQARLAFMLPR